MEMSEQVPMGTASSGSRGSPRVVGPRQRDGALATRSSSEDHTSTRVVQTALPRFLPYAPCCSASIFEKSQTEMSSPIPKTVAERTRRFWGSMLKAISRGSIDMSDELSTGSDTSA